MVRSCAFGAISAISAIVLVASSSSAIGGGLVVTAGSPRAIGRAGTGTVGDDGAGALLVNPAAMARRDGLRGQLGLAFSDDEISWQGARSAPVARNQSPSSTLPTGAVIGALGPWVIGVGAMTAAVADRAMRPPSDLPPGELGNAFEFRYAGVTGGIRRDTVTVGVARRIGEAVAVGVAVAGSRVAMRESRRLWAGFQDRNDVVGDPELDVEVAFDGRDAFAPGAVAGVLIAPSDDPIELAASIAWAQRVRIAADAGARTAGTPDAPRVALTDARATLELRQPWTLRAGARYLGERFVLELGGDVWLMPGGAATTAWQVEGLRVVDRSGASAELTSVPSRASLRTHGAIRGALEVELIGGFLWATTGYAFAVGGVAGGRQSPTFGDLGGHTLALGLEGTAGGFTFTLGWSRTWSVAQRADAALFLDNPFRAGDRAVPAGRYDGSIDQIGILLDAELDAPE